MEPEEIATFMLCRTNLGFTFILAMS